VTGRAGPVRSTQAGFTLVALMASITVMLIVMGAGARSWSYVMKDAREEELIFRGTQIVDAIERFQAKNGGALPVSIDVLVKGRFLRKAYKDPMTKDGKWRLVHQGELVGVGGQGPGPSPSPSGRPTPTPTPSPSPGGGPAGETLGGFIGVATRSREKSLRLFNGKKYYHEWIFAVGQGRVVGNTPLSLPTPGTQPSGGVQRPPT
jgi:type II secretory pathway pseudopilin PulG